MSGTAKEILSLPTNVDVGESKADDWKRLFGETITSYNVGMVRLFLARGCDPTDESALILACEAGKRETARLLLQNGATPKDTCFIAVVEKCQLDFLDLLLDYGKPSNTPFGKPALEVAIKTQNLNVVRKIFHENEMRRAIAEFEGLLVDVLAPSLILAAEQEEGVSIAQELVQQRRIVEDPMFLEDQGVLKQVLVSGFVDHARLFATSWPIKFFADPFLVVEEVMDELLTSETTSKDQAAFLLDYDYLPLGRSKEAFQLAIRFGLVEQFIQLILAGMVDVGNLGEEAMLQASKMEDDAIAKALLICNVPVTEASYESALISGNRAVIDAFDQNLAGGESSEEEGAEEGEGNLAVIWESETEESDGASVLGDLLDYYCDMDYLFIC